MKPTPTKKTELRYARALRNVARFSGQLVLMHVEGSTLTNVPGLERAVREYMAAITPWAQRRATEMVSAVNLTNEKYWVSAAKAAGRALRLEFAEAPTGQVARQLVAEQVGLITSLPLDAAQRAQRLAQEAVENGSRASEVARMLAETTGVTENRAMLIARTEVSKANSALNQARSLSIGADSYVWRTAGDGDVRESHAELEGKTFRFDDPPDHSDGSGTYNPGDFPNCRCYAETILPARDY
jgi:SPP1 gp7 family putative phage head morphogenesis protein